MTTTFEFVALHPPAGLKPGKDTLIRSRCMQGKNKRLNSRRSKKEESKKRVPDDLIPERGKPDSSLALSKSLNDFSIVRFAECDIDAEARSLLLKAFTYNVANPSTTPLDRCVDFDTFENVSFQWFFLDAAFLHSVLFATYAVDDLISPDWNGQPREKTLFHLRKTLKLLSQKVAAPGAHKDEASLNIVVQLGLVAACFGDWCAAIAHLTGLHKIISLRGGRDFLRTRPKLHFKIDRLDLAYSLSSGQKPFFQDAATSWQLNVSPEPSDTKQYHAPLEWDHRLPFLATTFRVPGRKMPYGWLADRIATTYTSVNTSATTLDFVFHLWVLAIAAISVTDSAELWLQQAWKFHTSRMDWHEVKRHLMSVMWIECIHDAPGETLHCKILDAALSETPVVAMTMHATFETQGWYEPHRCVTCDRSDRG
ncbi:hypothetical protein EK21DRAFT_78556 [Setomelanomma holmii]|uniref:Uncharacterized protein n=1 Tax=Setomelanomma holmii TaxID=210430 RepID=A0A9P4GX08_9PLEO|nr:hypothetical protein EK21DRAFT_78556 [Setomelanomma holmii]